MDILEALNTSSSDVLIFFTLIIVFVLVTLVMNQRHRYMRLRERVDGDLQKLKDQEGAIKKLENDLREYVMGGKSLREWKIVKQQIEELSDLPSFVEVENAYVLKIHLSMTKKDDVMVSGVKNGIKVTIDNKENPALQAFYSTPKDIDPNGLKVTYKGNSLEILAPKSAENASKT